MSSCIKEDMNDCPPAISKVALQFDYTYNVKQADAFAAEVKNINVYAFDENGKFFDSYIESREKFETGHTMEITGLKDGKYTFVCLARDRQVMSRAEDDEMEFSFASLTPGVSTIDDASILCWGFGIPVSVSYFALNAFLLLIAFRILGWQFCVKTLYAISLFAISTSPVSSLWLAWVSVTQRVTPSGSRPAAWIFSISGAQGSAKFAKITPPTALVSWQAHQRCCDVDC